EVAVGCQLGVPRAIAALLQRVGRSGHAVAGTPKGRLFPLSRDELVECAALLDSVTRGELDRLSVPEQALDVLAQQIVAEVATQEWGEDDLFALFRRAWPYRELPREDFLRIVHMLAEGFSTRRGRRGTVRVRDAAGQPPNVPFWLGEAPGRTDELSEAVSRLREEISSRLDASPSPAPRERVADAERRPGEGVDADSADRPL